MAEETTKLNKKNLDYIAKRSGQSKIDLELMLAAVTYEGRQVSVTYEVKEKK